GVPGVGDKTASSLVKQFGSIEGIYEAIEKKGKKPKLLTPKLIEKLETNKDQALFSKRLATIICDVDFEFDFDKTEWRKHMAREQLEKLLKDLALFSLVKRLDEIDGEATPSVRPAAPGPTAAGQLLDSDSAVESALMGIEKSGQVAIDIQAGLILATSDGKEAFGFPETMLKGKLKDKFSDILTNSQIEKTFRDEKEICRWALERGMELRDCSFDIHLAAYLINSDIHDFSLERLYFAEFEHDMSAEPLYRPIALAKLRERYQSKLSVLGLEKVFKTIELPLGPILAGMEQKGIKIDREAIKKLSVEIDKELAELEKQIYGHAGSPFNISSPKQLSAILFEKLAIKGKVRKTGKGAISTAAGELEKLIEEHPIIALILKYRELQKLKTTYIEPFPSLIAADGRLHTTYNQNGAVTGRLSSQDPNLQNIPIKTELGQKFRSAFIADNGFKLLSLDYSQLELRIAAHISGDKAMTEAFRTGLDIHTRTAAAIFKVKPDEVTANMRRQAKVLNFGLIYGMGVLGFQRASGVDRDTAREFIDNYMAEFSGVARYMKEIKEQAHKDGYVSTIFGRRRQLPEINSGMPQLVATAERMAINMPVQGTEADLLKLAMINVQKLIDEKYGDNVRMLLQVHDELLFEVKEDMVAEAAKDIRETMETAHKFDVPIVVDAKVGDNWSEMQKIKENN
ncbi:MAG TPA: DNA polymerase I, partial [Candidatus Paceibacterota bacterium]|nr:DNA polymerase I [Candidatus Paceibacterota bacterium]